jgi:hypothetical protein
MTRLLVAFVALCGCNPASTPVSLAPPLERVTAKDYDRLRERWTRSAQIIKLLDTTLRVHATLYSPEFIAAFGAMNGQLFKLPDGERTKLERQLGDEARRTHSFFVAASTSDMRWNDLEGKESVWRMALVNDQQEQLTPVEVRPQRDITPTTIELFPFVGDFYRTYIVRFRQALPDGRPLVRADTRQLLLRFSGALGQTDLVWRLK